MSKKKIAILGGGLGSMAAAYGISRSPGFEQEYELTIYQMGWRLGGKGASGRNAEHGQRIEEHGLHVWMGFYENAFRTMQECYAEIDRPEGAPLRTWRDAFKPCSTMELTEYVDGQWVKWPMTMPVNSATPGEGGALPGPWQYVQMAIQGLVELVGGEGAERAIAHWFAEDGSADAWRKTHGRSSGCNPLGMVLGWVGREAAHVAPEVLEWLGEHILHAHSIAQGMPDDPEHHEKEHHHSLLGALEKFLDRVKAVAMHFIESHDFSRRLWILSHLGLAGIRGILAEDLLKKGLAAADDTEFRAWLAKYGADEITLSSAPVREIYDLVFAYQDGDYRRPDIGAGTAMDIGFRIAFTYKGAAMWKMQAGMGDTVFSPIYQALVRRGVKFKFFHKVKKLELDATGQNVERILVDEQVALRDGLDSYDPLVDVKGLPCWPSKADYDQLADGAKLRAEAVNFESHWCAWPVAASHTLERGKDFDDVVLGLSFAPLPEICAELFDRNEDWKRMGETMKTVRTQCAQLWLDPSMKELGQDRPECVAGTYAEPLDTWADMSELLPREDWGADAPHSILYLCGPAEGGAGPPASDTEFPARAHSQIRQRAGDWLLCNASLILPKGSGVANPAGLDQAHLHDSGGKEGLDAQFYRMNVDPAERYVLTATGSTKHRLLPAKSGFDNLYPAGDWVRTPLSAGCVECGVMGGLAAAQAISGYPKEIVGWPRPAHDARPF